MVIIRKKRRQVKTKKGKKKTRVVRRKQPKKQSKKRKPKPRPSKKAQPRKPRASKRARSEAAKRGWLTRRQNQRTKAQQAALERGTTEILAADLVLQAALAQFDPRLVSQLESVIRGQVIKEMGIAMGTTRMRDALLADIGMTLPPGFVPTDETVMRRRLQLAKAAGRELEEVYRLADEYDMPEREVYSLMLYL